MKNTYTPRFGPEILSEPKQRWYAVTFYETRLPATNRIPAARTQMVLANSMIHAANKTHRYNRDIISITLQPDRIQY